MKILPHLLTILIMAGIFGLVYLIWLFPVDAAAITGSVAIAGGLFLLYSLIYAIVCIQLEE